MLSGLTWCRLEKRSPVQAPIVSLWPNPASDVLHVLIPDADHSVLLELFDASGRSVLSGQYEQGTVELNVSGLPAGVYHLVVTGEAGQETSTVLLE